MSSQQNKTAADLTKAINVFTKRLLWALTEGHSVDQEEIDALNDMRVEAGMKPLNVRVSQQPESGQPAAGPKKSPEPQPSRERGEAPRKKKRWEAPSDENFQPQSITVNGRPVDAQLLPDNAGWTNRFYIRSESSNRLYTIAQNKKTRSWGCTCPGWIGHAARNCKHLRAMGLPGGEEAYEAQIKAASAKTASIKFADEYSEAAHILAAELIHSDAELSKMMEPVASVVDGVSGVAHIDGPEAGPSNDEMHANQHEESGVPVTDGNLVSPERQNVTAIKDAIEGKAEMEIGKPISQKQEEVDIATEARDEKAMHPDQGAKEVSAKPGTQIIINVGSKTAGGSLKKGERIAIKPEWQDKGDENYEWYVVRDEDNGHVGIQALKPGERPGPLTPWQDVRADMVERLVEPKSAAGESKACKQCGSSMPKGGADVCAMCVTEGPESVRGQVPEHMKHKGAEGIGGEDDSKITSGHGGGMFGGTDLKGPQFHVGFTFRGTEREASFSTLREASKFIKSASEKFGKTAGGWTMKCPQCKQAATKNSPEDSYVCKNCGWDSHTSMAEITAKTKKPKKAAADPAKRNLVLEILSHGAKTTGEIEKALGGGKYTNISWPILQELGKEGLIRHKQMRWSLKASVAKKAYRVGKLAFSVSVETRVKEGNTVTPEVVANKLNEMFQDLKRKNPQDHMDSFEQQLPRFMMDIAQALHLQVDYTPEDDTYMFYDQMGAGTKDKKFEEFEPMDVTEDMEEIANRPPQRDLPDANDIRLESSLKAAKIRVTSAKSMPRKGTPEWHQLQIAIQTMKMPDPMVNVMGGPDREASERTLAEYGMRWDEQAYLSGGSGVKKAGDGMAKTEEQVEKEAGFNFFFPGQVVKEFYPEIQHEIVDYPNATNQPMSGAGAPEIVGDGGHELEGILDEALDTNVVEMIQLPADVGEVEPLAMAAADYSSTSPAGGLGIGRDGKPEVLEGAPLRKENDIRGYMFTDEFYGQYEGIPGAAMNVASKTAAEGDETKQFALFLKKVCGEIAATLVAAFKVTSRPLLDKVPGMGEIQLDVMEQGAGTSMPTGQTTQGGRVKWLMDKLNDGDIKSAINEAWAQAAVWNDNPEGGFVYEVFVRPETIDTDSLIMKYKFVCGTRE
jgi:hypothetical protein